jgi:glycosyltransferase involved in cell wall biosynthesis
MRIAVDARELTGRPTGVGRYLAELIRHWSISADARRHDWRFYAHAPAPDSLALWSTLSVLPGSGGTAWEQWTLPRALADNPPDVFFAPGYTAPLTAPCPTAVTIHDVSFLAHPEWFRFREGLRRRALTAWSARRARLVLTDSAFSSDEIEQHLGIGRDKVRVIPLGMNGARAPENDRARLDEPIVLFVGSIFRRRHVDRLIEAFVQLVSTRLPHSRLEIVGENRTYPSLDLAAVVARAPEEIARRISIRSYVDETTLRDLYARAAVFAFPSEYEGFGLTPLEALAAGVPPVVLDTPISREIYGRAARYVSVDLAAPAALADAIVELITSPAARDAVLKHADEVLARYDWRRAAEQTLLALEEAAGV